MRYFIELSYNGKNYYGWQAQKNQTSVQGDLEHHISVILRSNIQVVGAGRTDAGVHSKFMTAHFDFIDEIDTQKLVNQLNAFLPKDIAIYRIFKVADTTHARFDAVKRTYEYHIFQKKNPFLNGWALYFPHRLNFEKMNEAASILLKYKDFTSFSKLHTDTKTNYCTIFEAFWQQRGEIWVFTVTANRFLRNMVRAIVGTLLLVGTEKISVGDFRDIIEQKNRGKAGNSVAPEGLYLTDIEYKIKS
jgi:tRNA pseudouridine38-40 synthase